MPLAGAAPFALLLCSYAAFEFFIKRALLTRRGQVARTVTLYAVMLAGTAGVASPTVAGVLLVFALAHAVIESGLAAVERRFHDRTLELFIAKQLLCAAALIAVSRFALMAPHQWFTDMTTGLVNAGSAGRGTGRMVVAAIITGYLFVIDGGTRTVRGILDKFPGLYSTVTQKLNAEIARNDTENVGEWIGVLERLIALTFVLTGNLTALAFALTAKSIARFKELEDKQFSEYYILGTSASLIVALFTGMAIRLMFGI